MYDTNRLVMVVHAIDTEGPLSESLDATFERLHHLFGVENLPHTEETLDLLRKKALPLGGIEDHVAHMLSNHSLTYKKSWKEIDAMLPDIGQTLVLIPCKTHGHIVTTPHG